MVYDEGITSLVSNLSMNPDECGCGAGSACKPGDATCANCNKKCPAGAPAEGGAPAAPAEGAAPAAPEAPAAPMQ